MSDLIHSARLACLEDEAVSLAEQRLGVFFPESYRSFLRRHSGAQTTLGRWRSAEELAPASSCAVAAFPALALLAEKHLRRLVPVFEDEAGDNYVLLDCRVDGAPRVFRVWSDETQGRTWADFDAFLSYARPPLIPEYDADEF